MYGGGCREEHASGRSRGAEEVVERARGGLLEGVEEVAHGGAAFGEAAREVGALAEGVHFPLFPRFMRFMRLHKPDARDGYR